MKTDFRCYSNKNSPENISVSVLKRQFDKNFIAGNIVTHTLGCIQIYLMFPIFIINHEVAR